MWPTKISQNKQIKIVHVSEWEHGTKYFQESPYFAHCEAIFLALLSDEDMTLRLWAAEKIIKIREENNPDVVRVWKKPVLVLDPIPEHYKDMINWDNETITEPPPTKNISNDDLLKIGNGEKKLEDFIPKIFCHR